MGSKVLESGIKINHVTLVIINKHKMVEKLDSRVLRFCRLGLSAASLIWNTA